MRWRRIGRGWRRLGGTRNKEFEQELTEETEGYCEQGELGRGCGYSRRSTGTDDADGK